MSSTLHPAPTRVLLVEDDQDLRKILAYALRKQGYEVLVTPNGLPALQVWRAAHPDVVLLAVEAQDSSGMGVLDRIRWSGKTPVVVLTAANDPDLFAECLQRGANEVILKPFRTGYLVECIEKVSGASPVQRSSVGH